MNDREKKKKGSKEHNERKAEESRRRGKWEGIRGENGLLRCEINMVSSQVGRFICFNLRYYFIYSEFMNLLGISDEGCWGGGSLGTSLFFGTPINI